MTPPSRPAPSPEMPERPAPFRAPAPTARGEARTPWARVLGHTSELRRFHHDLLGARNRSEDPERYAMEAPLEAWMALSRGRVLLYLLRSLRARDNSAGSDERPRLFWLAHPRCPAWLVQLSTTRVGRLWLTEGEHQRLQLRTPQSGVELRPLIPQEPGAAMDRDRRHEQAPGLYDGLLGLDAAQIQQLVSALVAHPSPDLREVNWVLTLTRDPRPWPPAVWQAMATVLERIGARMHDPAPAARPHALMAWLLEPRVLQTWCALLLRADVPPDVSARATTALRAPSLSGRDRQQYLIQQLEITPDFVWGARQTPATAVLQLLEPQRDGELPQMPPDRSRALARWLAQRLRPGTTRSGLRVPETEHATVWETLRQTPTLLLDTTMTLMREAATVDPQMLAAAQRACQQLPASAWRPFLLANDPDTRVRAIAMLGARADQTAGDRAVAPLGQETTPPRPEAPALAGRRDEPALQPKPALGRRL